MKKKSHGKATPKNAPAPPPAALLVIHGQAKEGDQIPQHDLPPPLPSLIELAARKYFPNVEEDAPEWAKRAAKMAFASAMPTSRKRKASEKYLEGFASGKFSAAEELLPDDMRPTLPSEFGGLDDVELQDALKLQSDLRAEFFCGFRDGEKCVREMPERAKATQRVKMFRIIAAEWHEAKKCEGNAGNLHRWLETKGAIVQGTDYAATRKVCKLIGFPMREKAGRPTNV